MKNRQAEIKSKGFKMGPALDDIYQSPNPSETDFSKIKVGIKTVEDAILTKIGDYSKVEPRYVDKKVILQAIHDYNYQAMREISNFYFKTSGIYSRLCRYMAYLYKYDWIITPYINDKKVDNQVILDKFQKVLYYFDKSELKKMFGEIALKVIRQGSYYAYLIEAEGQINLQELSPKYSRSRYKVGNWPVVEFNMRYFDEQFKDPAHRLKILNNFPPEFKKGYILYKEGKLQPDYQGDKHGWYALEVGKAIKFNLNGEDFPAFISVIPSIIDLNEAQALDRKKMAQKLLKIIIQKMPLDKNGDLVFDVDEAQQLHNNVVQMLQRAIGVDVLTTFADVDVADMSDRSTTTNLDELSKVERGVYNEAGVSQMQFNTDGNIALEKSIMNDEAAMSTLIQQFGGFLNNLLVPFNKSPRKFYFRAQILPTTIYNYKDLAKLYKEQTALGYSKMLPQVALGQSQSSILATAYFENDVLDLASSLVPPMSSNTMSSKAATSITNKEAGRPKKDDDQKAEKTIQNEESKN